MNDKIVQQLINLEIDYKKSYLGLSFKDNNYFLFNHELKIYYQKLTGYILPDLRLHLMNVKEDNIKNYYPYIREEWIDMLSSDIKKADIVGSKFLEKLSEDLLSDFSHLFKAYQKTGADKLKHHFIQQFFNNKSHSVYLLIKNNPSLGIKTISKLKSPQLQFQLINQNNAILEELFNFFKKCSLKERNYLLTQYFDYPQDIPVDKYYRKWLGGEFIHVKFCKIIFGDKYEKAKNFIKQKNEMNLNINID